MGELLYFAEGAPARGRRAIIQTLSQDEQTLLALFRLAVAPDAVLLAASRAIKEERANKVTMMVQRYDGRCKSFREFKLYPADGRTYGSLRELIDAARDRMRAHFGLIAAARSTSSAIQSSEQIGSIRRLPTVSDGASRSAAYRSGWLTSGSIGGHFQNNSRRRRHGKWAN